MLGGELSGPAFSLFLGSLSLSLATGTPTPGEAHCSGGWGAGRAREGESPRAGLAERRPSDLTRTEHEFLEAALGAGTRSDHFFDKEGHAAGPCTDHRAAILSLKARPSMVRRGSTVRVRQRALQQPGRASLSALR
jgi:hypothetical protein